MLNPRDLYRTNSLSAYYVHTEYRFCTLYVLDFLDSSNAFSFCFSAHHSPLFAHCLDLSMPRAAPSFLVLIILVDSYLGRTHELDVPLS